MTSYVKREVGVHSLSQRLDATVMYSVKIFANLCTFAVYTPILREVDGRACSQCADQIEFIVR